MKVIDPSAVTDAILVDSSVDETDYAQWDDGVSYSKGARVLRNDLHRIFESVVDSNLGYDPETNSPGKWIDAGATNRWAMFDQSVGSVTQAVGTIEIELAPDGDLDALAVLDTDAATVQVEIFDGVTSIYDVTLERAESVYPSALVFEDLPFVGGASIIVTIAAADGGDPVSVGTLMIGETIDLGLTEENPSIGINDFSRRETDDFGNTTITERAWAKRMSVRALIPTEWVDEIQRRLAGLRAKAAFWMGETGFDSLAIYGFFKDFSIDLPLETISHVSLTVEGLTQAAAIDVLSAGLIPAGSYDPDTVYRIRQVVQYEGSSWYYINDVATHGNAPPTLPDEENDFWRVFAAAGGVGEQGPATNIIFQRSATEPATPAPSEDTPAGWYEDTNSVPAGSDPIWASYGKRPNEEADWTWQTPIPAQAINGTNAKLVRLTASSLVFLIDAAGANTPASITVTAAGQYVTGSPSFSVTAGTATLTGTGSTRTLTFANMGSDQVTIQVSWDGQTDTVTIDKLRAGTHAIAFTNSNGSHTMPASNTGVVSDYSGSGTTIRVYEGATPLTFHTTLAAGRFTVGTPTVSPGSSLTVGARSGSGTTSCTVADHSGASNSVDVITVTYPITARRADGTDVTFDIVQTITKSKVGATGASAKLVRLTATSHVFLIDTAGVNSPSSIDVTAVGQAVSGSPSFSVISGTATLTGSGNSRTLTFANMVSDQVTIEVTWDGQSDTVTIDKLRAGTHGITATNANGSHTVPASNAGVVSDYSGSGTTIQVYEGATPLTFHTTLAAGRFTVGTPTVSPGSSLTVGARSGSGTATCSVADHSGASNSVDVITVTYPITARRADGTDVTFNIVQTITKSKAGATGASAKLVRLTATSYVFLIDTAGGNTPSSIDINAVGQAVSGSPSFSVISGTATLTGSGNSRTLTFANMGSDQVTIQVSWDGQSDTVTIDKLRAGTHGVSFTNANGSHSLPASNSGVVSDYSGSGTSILVYEGATALTFHTTLAAGRFTVGTPTVSPGSSLTVGARSGSGSTTCTVADHSGASNSADVITVTYPITARRADGSDVTFNIVQTITKSKTGAQGATGGTGPAGRDAVTFQQDSTPSSPVVGDTWVTFTAPKVWKKWNGSDWVQLLGNIAAYDAVSASQMAVSQLSAITATIGTLRTATSGARTEIKDNLIEVYNSSNVLIVRIGQW